jgi:hypothetical protein
MAHGKTDATPFYGLMAEFDSAQSLMDAAQRTTDAGYTKKDAFSPFPIHGLAEALGFKERWVSKIVLACGITGALGGWGLEYWTQAIDYPMNIGGRPYYAWVSFIPPAYETTILLSAIGAAVGMLILNGLPQPYHPVFNVPAFARASQDKFFLAIEATDPKFDAVATKEFLQGLHARQVVEIAN